MFFLIACTLSTLGPGAIPAVALIAPLAFATAAPAGIPVFLTALMVANGANAGNLSPVSAVGVIANSRMASVGLGGHEWKVWAANFLAHLLVAMIAYAVLVRRIPARDAAALEPPPPVTKFQWLTMGVVFGWVAAVLMISAPLGLSAFAAAVLLVVSGAADESLGLKGMPWSAILMVCGVAMLVTTAERAGGLELFTALLAKLATPATLNGVIAFVTGVISSCSSTSGVVLPTFLPTAPGLVQQVGGGDPLAVALSINVGSSLVDVSPLSTIGALCVAAVAEPHAARELVPKNADLGTGDDARRRAALSALRWMVRTRCNVGDNSKLPTPNSKISKPLDREFILELEVWSLKLSAVSFPTRFFAVSG